MQATIYQNLQALLHYSNNSEFSPNNIKTVIIGPDGLIVGYHVNKAMSFKGHTPEGLISYHSDPKAKPLLKALHEGIQFPSVEEVIIIQSTRQQVFRPQDCSPANLVRNSSYSLEGLKQDYKRLRYFTIATAASAVVMPALFNLLVQQGLNKPGLLPKTISQYISECGMQVNATTVHSDNEYYLDSGISIKSRETYPQMDGADGTLNKYFMKVKQHLLEQQSKADAQLAAENEKKLAIIQAENLEKFCEVIKHGVLNSKVPENMIYKTFNTEAYDTLKSKMYKYPKFTEKVQASSTPKKYLKDAVTEVVEDVAHTCKIKLKTTMSETVQEVLEGETSLAREAVRRLRALVDIEPDIKLNAIVRQLGRLAPTLTVEAPILVNQGTFLRLDKDFDYIKSENNLCAYKKDRHTGITFRTPIFAEAKTNSYNLDTAMREIVTQYAQLCKYKDTKNLTGVINLNTELSKLQLKASSQAIPNDVILKRILLDYKDNLFTREANYNPEDNILLFTLIAKYL